jgi:Lrp/AsnC family transcriptional regulator for asnA, asnC and gidA
VSRPTADRDRASGTPDISPRFAQPEWRGQVAEFPRFDETDSKIAEALCRNGRESFRDISTRLDISEATVRNRYNRLVESGTLRVFGVVSPIALGYEFMALLALSVDGPVEEIADLAMEPRTVDYGVITSGRFDILLECVCVSRQQLLEELHRITQIKGVASVEVFTYFTHFKYLTNWKAPDSHYDVPGVTDQLDLQVIRALQQDGRQSFREVARQIGTSEATVRTRFSRLVNDGVLRVSGIYNGVAASAIGGLVGLTATGDLTPIATALSDHPRVDYVVLTAGRYNIIAEIFCASHREFLDAVSDWRAMPGVASTETLSYLKMVKQVLDWLPATDELSLRRSISRRPIVAER